MFGPEAFGAMTSLTGGGGMGDLGGSSSTGALDSTSTSNNSTEAGNISNGGISIQPKGFRFDSDNPVHLAGAGLAVLAVGVLLLKVAKR